MSLGAQKELHGWEAESGGDGIRFAEDFYTPIIGVQGGNAKQPLLKGLCEDALSGRVCCFHSFSH